MSIKDRYSKVIKQRYMIVAVITIIMLHLALLFLEADEKAAFEIAERLRKAIENASIDFGADQIVKFTISIGMITVTPDENTSIHTV